MLTHDSRWVACLKQRLDEARETAIADAFRWQLQRVQSLAGAAPAPRPAEPSDLPGLARELLEAQARCVRTAHSGGQDPHRHAACVPALHPVLVMHELQSCLPSDAILLVEVGNSMGFALQLLIGERQRFILNLNVGSMGHSLGGALGARHAAPARPVIALVGDAAFAMNGFEVHTAVESDLGPEACGGPLFLVMANGGNGMVARGAAHRYATTLGDHFGMYRVPLNVDQIAAGMGAQHAVVDAYGQLAAAFGRALAPGLGPTVLEVRIDPSIPSPIDSRLAGVSGQASAGAHDG